MRQLPIQLFNVGSGSTNDPMITAHIPAGAWASGKSLILRFVYEFLLPAGTTPNPQTVQGFIVMSQASTALPLVLNSLIPSANDNIGYIEFKLIRIDPNVFAINMNAGYSENGIVTTPTGTVGGVILPAVPPFDFGLPIDLSYVITLSAAVPAYNIITQWGQCLLEAGTKLG